MLTGPAADMLKALTGHTDDFIAQLHPGYEKFFKQMPKLLGHSIIGEVIKAEHCTAQVKVGDKLVFDPYLNPQKSTGVMCPKALLPVLIQVNALWEMLAEWAASGKEDPAEIVFRTTRCLDPGDAIGGMGEVVYRIRTE